MIKELIEMSQTLVVALTLFYECGNQPWEGKVLVLDTIVNRSRKMNMTLKQVCLQPRQYSCWNGRKTQRKLVRSTATVATYNSVSWRECMLLAKMAGSDAYMPTTGATHYFNPHIVKPAPIWIKRMKLVDKVGDHAFYQLPEGK